MASTASTGSSILSALGAGSGINIQNIVSQLIVAEGQPQQQQITNQQNNLSAKLSAYGKLKSSLSSLGSALSSLGSLKAGRSANVSGTGVSATASNSAATGNYAVGVQQLAQAESLASDGVASQSTTLGTGTLTLQVGNGTATNITIDSSNNTLQGVASAINSANAGVSASVAYDGSQYHLILNGDSTGAANTISVTPSSGLTGLTFSQPPLTAAQDAKFTVNGMAVTSASNTNTTAIQGVTLKLNQVTTTPANVNVAVNNSSVTNAVQKMVSAYNSFAKLASSDTAYNASTKQAGVLLGDATLQTVQSQLQQALVTPASGSSSNSATGYSTLASIGITTDKNGQMSLDTTKLNAALNSNFGGVVSMLNKIGNSMNSMVSSMTTTGGVLDAATSSINSQLKSLSKQQTALNNRMNELQSSLMQQYTAMDTLVAQMQNTGKYLTQQLASLPSASSSSSSKSGG